MNQIYQPLDNLTLKNFIEIINDCYPNKVKYIE